MKSKFNYAKQPRKCICRRLVSLLLLACMTISFGLVATAQEPIKVFVDDVQVQFDVEPRIIDDRTMVPMRAIFEAIGAAVTWDGANQKIIAYNDVYFVEATIGSKTILVNGKEIVTDVAPLIIDGRTLVSARFVVEAFDCNVKWNGDTRTVDIKTNPVNPDKVEPGWESSSSSSSSYKPSYTPSTQTSYYYPGTTIPTYTSVTGVTLKEIYRGTTATIYNYPHTKVGKYYEVVDYMSYLRDCGWSEYSTEQDAESISWYYTKGYDMIGISYHSQYGEVWILVSN